jgi:hypothetical protein
MSSAARDPRKNPEPGWWVAPFVFYLIVGFAILLVMVTSCSPRIIETIRYQRDTTYVQQVKVDSVYRRDSVFVREKGDTVFIYKERIRDRYVFRHDTLRLVKVDSVAVERVKEVKVEKPLSAWKSAKIGAFWWLVAAVLLLLLWTFRKPILKLLHL